MLNKADEWDLRGALHVTRLDPDCKAEEDHRSREDRRKDREPAIGVDV